MRNCSLVASFRIQLPKKGEQALDCCYLAQVFFQLQCFVLACVDINSFCGLLIIVEIISGYYVTELYIK